jgi:tRNA (guanine-N7-)-methyltransferase
VGAHRPGRPAARAELSGPGALPPRLHGRSRGRPLSARQQALVDDLLPRLALPDGADGAPLDPAALFAPPPAEVWLEIGFGGGEHLVAQAGRRPDVGLIGVEPFLDGVAKALTAIDALGLGNVRLAREDARGVVARLPDASLARVFVLFPDPWPKARHHKRRLIQPAFASELARVLKPGGRLRFATDWADYATQALLALRGEGRLRWTARRADDWRLPPADHVTTRYQEKRLGDCAPMFFDFERVGVSG